MVPLKKMMKIFWSQNFVAVQAYKSLTEKIFPDFQKFDTTIAVNDCGSWGTNYVARHDKEGWTATLRLDSL